MACTACLVCFISSVNGHCNNKKKEAYPWKAGTCSGHTTKLKQSILETFDIYGRNTKKLTAQRYTLLSGVDSTVHLHRQSLLVKMPVIS